MSTEKRKGGRFTAQRKMEIILHLVRGDDLESVSRKEGVTAAKLTEWKDSFLAGGQAALKARPRDGRDDEIQALRAKVGELTMENEVLQEGMRRAGGRTPFRPRKSSK